MRRSLIGVVLKSYAFLARRGQGRSHAHSVAVRGADFLFVDHFWGNLKGRLVGRLNRGEDNRIKRLKQFGDHFVYIR